MKKKYFHTFNIFIDLREEIKINNSFKQHNFI